MANQQYPDWSAVEAQYGNAAVQQLQQNNVPLSQVSQVINSASPGYFAGTYAGPAYQSGGSDPGMGGGYPGQGYFNQQGLGQALASYFGGGGFQQPQAPSFDPTQNPNYPTELLGAQALQAVGLNPHRQVTVNPSPAQTPSSSQFAQSGVSSVASPQTVQYSKNLPMPQTNQPSIFSPATPLPPTTGTPLSPAAQYNAANMPHQGTGGPQVRQLPAEAGAPYAAPPPIMPVTMPPVGLPPTPNTLPSPPAAPGNAIAGSPFGGPISGLSPSATPPGPASLPSEATKHMAAGGSVGDTDTVPAMLTPGEYVINRNAAQQIGRGRLDQLNAGGAIHMQDGGSIPGASPSSSYSPGADAQSYAFNQLTPQEQVALQGGGTAGQRVQQKFNQLVNNYQGSSGSPTPMSAQMGGGSKPTAIAQVHPLAPSAPTGQPQPQQPQAYSGSLDQWLAQYGHTPQGQAYIGQNGNVGEVQRYLQNLTTPQTGTPAYTDYAPRASLAAAPAGYGAAPRAQLVGLPAGQGEAYDPKTYGINTGASSAAGVAGNIAGAVGQIAQAFTKGAGASQPYRPIQSAIPSPSDFKSQTPDIVLQGHQVNKPNAQGGYVLMAQPYDQSGEQTGYLS